MAFSKIWVVLSFVLLWTGVTRSGEIKYDDIAKSIERGNQRMKALDLMVESEEKKTGSLARSFIPDVTLLAGQEDFHSDRLGDQSSGFYGIEAKAKIFNGMSDYWEEEKRKSNVVLARVQRQISRNEMIFEARKAYLKLAEAKKIKAELTESLNRLDEVFKKVRLKVKGGVISNSDLTSLRLVQVEFEYSIKDLEGVVAVESGRLKTLLSVSDIGVGDIDEQILALKQGEFNSAIPGRLLLEERYKAESDSSESESKIKLAEKLPSLSLFANYGRRPFSQREFIEKADREDWAAGVQLTWEIGGAWESSRQAQSARLQSMAAKQLGGYSSEEVKNHIQALEQQMRLLYATARGLEKEIGLSQNYYSQISAEYLRGVKSTSDLTSTFGQLLELKKHRVRLLFQYRLAQAEIEKFIGEN